MTETKSESELARAHPTAENVTDSTALRALTALTVGLLVAAVLVFALPLMAPHETAVGDASLQALSSVEILIGAIVAATGVVALAIRLATGVILRAIAGRAATGR